MRVGIYPGAFDPIHEGHVVFARAAAKQFKLDKIFFLVEPRPRRKQGVRALEHRVAMVQLALKDDAHLGVIVLEEARFAIDSTWPKIQARMAGAELYMIMGEGNLNHIVHWPQIGALVDAAPVFIIGTKNEEKRHELQDQLYTLQHTKAFPFMYQLLPIPLPKLKSRQIRTALRKGTLTAGLQRQVAEYIRQHKLYISGAI